MSNSSRILIVDDTPSIHEDFKKILSTAGVMGNGLDEMADTLFGGNKQDSVYKEISYQLDSAFQGEEALNMIRKAEDEDKGYSLIFMDVRMPPGLDGIKTISRIWESYPSMEIVICTAYSDYSWVDIIDILGPSDHLLVLKKPFDADEAQQMALSMTRRAVKAIEQHKNLNKLEKNLEDCEKCVNQLENEMKNKK